MKTQQLATADSQWQSTMTSLSSTAVSDVNVTWPSEKVFLKGGTLSTNTPWSRELRLSKDCVYSNIMMEGNTRYSAKSH